MPTEMEINNLVNKHLVDKFTATDDLLGMLLKLQYDNNNLLSHIINITLNKTINLDTDYNALNVYDEKSLVGLYGVTLSSVENGNIVSCVINGRVINGIAKSDIGEYERIIVVPGGSDTEPYVVTLGILIKGEYEGEPKVVATDVDGNLISEITGSEGIPVLQNTIGALISEMQGSEEIAVKQEATGELVSVMQGSEGIDIKQKATTGELISEMQGSEGIAVKQEATGEMIAIMQGDYGGILRTIAVDALGLMQTDVSKSEKISIIRTDKDINFTSSIVQYNHDTENLTGLTDNKVYIRGINAQSDQNLKYRLIFWTKDTFDDTDLDSDAYIDDVLLDFTDTESVFRINNTNQYYINISGLGILYEDEDESNEIHCSLQNLSATSKNAGATGEIQIDFKYAPRL